MAGVMTGGVTGLFTVFYTIVLDGPGALFLPGAVVGGLIGCGIGWYGQRILMHPVVPGLAAPVIGQIITRRMAAVPRS
ncbi:MAG: hypothetical protein HOV83_08475 [Catenulispora sp.]|nr:hypothetical protein [Catenulispora sp.]